MQKAWESITEYTNKVFVENKSIRAVTIVQNNRQIMHYHYQYLFERSNQLAHFIQKKSFNEKNKSEFNFVAVCLPKSCELYVSMFSIWKMGAIYFPVSPYYSLRDLLFKINDVGPKCILINNLTLQLQPKLLEELKKLDITIINVDTDKLEIDQCSAQYEDCKLEETTPAYLIYTSGTSGLPKGVLIPHLAIVDRYLDHQKIFNLTSKDKILQWADIRVDVSIIEATLAFCSGAELCAIQYLPMQALDDLPDIIKLLKITLAIFPPPLAKALRLRAKNQDAASYAAKFSSLDYLISATAKSEKELLDPWLTFGRDNMNPRKIGEGYGPTELSWGASITLYSGGEIIIGTRESIFTGLTIYIYRDGKLQLDGEGEIFAAGQGIMLGYWNNRQINEKKTQEAIVELMTIDNEQIRGYRTGDQGRFVNDRLYYLHRISSDRQVKLLANRLELQGIETKFKTHSAIKDVTVELDEKISRLIGYLTLNDGHEKLTVEDLRIWFGQSIGFVNVNFPSILYVVKGESKQRLPLSNNTDHKLPENDYEEQVHHIWCEILSENDISIDDDFFNLGADSLQFINMKDIIRSKYNVILQTDDITGITIRSIAKEILYQKVFKAGLTCSRCVENPKGAFIFLPPLAGNSSEHYNELINLVPSQLEVYQFSFPLQSTTTIYPDDQHYIKYSEFYADLTFNKILTLIGQVVLDKTKQENVYLAGWSFGGDLVFGLADLLHKKGKSICYLGLIDTQAPQQCLRMSLLQQASRWDHILNTLISTVLPPLPESELGTESIENSVEATIDYIEKRSKAALTLLNNSGDSDTHYKIVNLIRTATQNLKALLSFKPDYRVYEAYLYRATKPSDGESVETTVADWQPYVNNLHLGAEIDDTHLGILRNKDFQHAFVQNLKLSFQTSSSYVDLVERLKRKFDSAFRQDSLHNKYIPIMIHNTNHAFSLEYIVDDFIYSDDNLLVIMGKRNSGKHVASLIAEKKIWDDNLENKSHVLAYNLHLSVELRGNENLKEIIPSDYEILLSLLKQKMKVILIITGDEQRHDLIRRVLLELIQLDARIILFVGFSMDYKDTLQKVLPSKNDQPVGFKYDHFLIAPLDRDRCMSFLQGKPTALDNNLNMELFFRLPKLFQNPVWILAFESISRRNFLREGVSPLGVSALFFLDLIRAALAILSNKNSYQIVEPNHDKSEEHLFKFCQRLAVIESIYNKNSISIDFDSDDFVSADTKINETRIDSSNLYLLRLLDGVILSSKRSSKYQFMTTTLKDFFTVSFIKDSAEHHLQISSALLSHGVTEIPASIFTHSSVMWLKGLFEARSQFKNVLHKALRANVTSGNEIPPKKVGIMLTLASKLNISLRDRTVQNLRLSNSDLNCESLSGSQFENSTFSQNVYIYDANLSGTRFINSDISACDFGISIIDVPTIPEVVEYHRILKKILFTSEGVLSFFDPDTCQIVQQITVTTSNSKLTCLQLSDNNILLGSMNGKLYVLNPNSNSAPLELFDSDSGAILDVKVLPGRGGDYVIVKINKSIERGSIINRLNQNHTITASFVFPNMIYKLFITVSVLFAIDVQGQLFFIDYIKGNKFKLFASEQSFIDSCDVDDESNISFCLSEQGDIYCLNFSTETQTRLFNNVALNGKKITYIPQARLLAVLTNEKSILIIDPFSEIQVRLIDNYHSDFDNITTYSSEGIIAFNNSARLYLWNNIVQKNQFIITNDGAGLPLKHIAFSHNGDYLVAVDRYNTITIHTVANNVLFDIYDKDYKDTMISSLISATTNDPSFACSTVDTIDIWNYNQHQRIAVINAEHDHLLSLVFHNHHNYSLYYSHNDVVYCYKSSTGRAECVFKLMLALETSPLFVLSSPNFTVPSHSNHLIFNLTTSRIFKISTTAETVRSFNLDNNQQQFLKLPQPRDMLFIEPNLLFVTTSLGILKWLVDAPKEQSEFLQITQAFKSFTISNNLKYCAFSLEGDTIYICNYGHWTQGLLLYSKMTEIRKMGFVSNYFYCLGAYGRFKLWKFDADFKSAVLCTVIPPQLDLSIEVDDKTLMTNSQRSTFNFFNVLSKRNNPEELTQRFTSSLSTHAMTDSYVNSFFQPSEQHVDLSSELQAFRDMLSQK